MVECSLVVELKDVPGALLPILEILKEFKANISSIHHLRDKKIDKKVDVEIIMDFNLDKEAKLVKNLKKINIPLISFNSILKNERLIAIILGRLSPQDTNELSKGIALRKGILDELKLKNEGGCAKVKILGEHNVLPEVRIFLDKFCKEKELVIIR